MFEAVDHGVQRGGDGHDSFVEEGNGVHKMLQAERRRNVAGADNSRQFMLCGPPLEAASPGCLVLSNPAFLY